MNRTMHDLYLPRLLPASAATASSQPQAEEAETPVAESCKNVRRDVRRAIAISRGFRVSDSLRTRWWPAATRGFRHTLRTLCGRRRIAPYGVALRPMAGGPGRPGRV